jgi:hypothetical protein
MTVGPDAKVGLWQSRPQNELNLRPAACFSDGLPAPSHEGCLRSPGGELKHLIEGASCIRR